MACQKLQLNFSGSLKAVWAFTASPPKYSTPKPMADQMSRSLYHGQSLCMGAPGDGLGRTRVRPDQEHSVSSSPIGCGKYSGWSLGVRHWLVNRRWHVNC